MNGRAAFDGKPKSVDMRHIKEWATTRLGPHSALRKVIEKEEESVEAAEFMGKLGVWLQLLDLEEGRMNG